VIEAEEEVIEEAEEEVTMNIDQDQELLFNKMKMEMKLLNLKDTKDSHSEVNQDTKMITHSIEEMELEEEEEEFQKRDMEKETGAQTETKLKKLLLKETLKKLLKDKAGLEMLMLKKKKRRENLEEKRKL